MPEHQNLARSPFAFSVPTCTWGIHFEEWRQLIMGTACLGDVVNSSRLAVFKSQLGVFLKDMQYFNLKLRCWCKNCWAKLCALCCAGGQTRWSQWHLLVLLVSVGGVRGFIHYYDPYTVPLFRVLFSSLLPWRLTHIAVVAKQNVIPSRAACCREGTDCPGGTKRWGPWRKEDKSSRLPVAGGGPRVVKP